MKATLYTDGGSRGNPGPSGIGFVLTKDGQTPISQGKYIGEGTNNRAEYLALIEGLLLAKKEGVKELHCFLDSELVVKQLKGQYRVKHVDLKPLFAEVKKLTIGFTKVTFTHVKREKNKLADLLVNEAIDNYVGRH